MKYKKISLEIEKVNVHDKYLPKEKFITELRVSGIKYLKEYATEFRNHLGWPAAPWAYYDEKWTNLIGKNFLPKDQFIEELRDSGIKSVREYQAKYKDHTGWPADPRNLCNESWLELLGEKLLPKDQFIEELRDSGIKTVREYQAKYKDLTGWPANPSKIYNEPWSVLVGKRLTNCKFITKEQFIEELTASGIKYLKEYSSEFRKHMGWPATPWTVYNEPWTTLIGNKFLQKN